jgi:FG-GAP repeat
VLTRLCDLDGDGYDELAIGGSSKVYVIYGGEDRISNFPINLYDIIDSHYGFEIDFGTILGTDDQEMISCLGDIDGDGFNELWIGNQ